VQLKRIPAWLKGKLRQFSTGRTTSCKLVQCPHAVQLPLHQIYKHHTYLRCKRALSWHCTNAREICSKKCVKMCSTCASPHDCLCNWLQLSRDAKNMLHKASPATCRQVDAVCTSSGREFGQLHNVTSQKFVSVISHTSSASMPAATSSSS